MALESYVKMTVGGKEFPGETKRDPHAKEKRSPVLRIEYSMYRPRDLQRNSFQNEPIHKPFRFVKEVGTITPLIHKAICEGTQIDKIQFTTYRMNPKNRVEQFLTITLEDAHFVSQQIMTGTPDDGAEQTSKGPSETDTRELEVVELHYRQMTIRNEVVSNESTYDWNEPVIA